MIRVSVFQRLALLGFFSVVVATGGCTADFNVAHLPHADVVSEIDATTADGSIDALDTRSDTPADVAPDGVVADGDAADCPAGCPSGETCCSGACVDLNSSPDHCGTCASQCRGTICLGGQCTGTCAMGRLDCDGNVVNGCEVNAATDAMNCGACARACRTDQMCTDGACVCMTGMGDCDGLASNGCEANTMNDAQNCGACGMRCGAGEACTAGHCGCAMGFADCDHMASNGCEVDSRTDGANCGACGTVCGANATCTGGTCQCSTGFLSCGTSFACTTAATDPANCGACGTSCGGLTPVCGTSGCSTGCLASETRCGSSCVDTATDANNCGACGMICTVSATAPAGSTAARCTGSMCAIQCLPGFADCDGNVANGCEVDTRTTAANCGTCGNACGSAQFCASGSCTCPSSLHDCGGGVCAQCCTNTDCNDGNACTGDVCTSGSCTHSTCGGSTPRCCGATVGCQVCCGDTDCSSLSGHLGCAGDGTCTTCAAGFRDCNMMPADGCEADLTTSTLNCGSCGNTCTFANAAGTCSGGVCRLGMCNTGYADCDGNPANGCEVNLNTSGGNCGSCGNACTASGTVCSGGICVVGTCSPGTGNCDGNAANGCEANINTDPSNCGSCMTVCSFANATATCSAGACTLGSCNTGFADCDSNPANGCETNLLGDTANCGACNNACTFPNGSAMCSNGGCTLGTCNANFGNCDGNAANGCETDLRTSLAHCGTCTSSCSGSVANATLTCANSACAYTCNPGFADCNGSASDGCEVVSTTNPSHCGLCSTACSTPTNASAYCEGGSCAYACTATNANCDNNAANGCEATTTSDVNNCGGCGIQCHVLPHASRFCASSTCGYTCSTGYADCDGLAANGCEVNLLSDPSHCGSCTTTCGGITPNCETGSCSATCGINGLSPCNGSCVNRTTDRNNCGSCGHVCGDDETCSSSTCQGIAACTGSQTACEGLCVSLSSDPLNCGGCGQACGIRQMCSAGHCAIPGDDCTNPRQVALTSGPVAFDVDTSLFTNTPNSCTSGPDGYFSITLTQQELVYVDTFGTASGGPAVTLAFLDRCGSMPTGAACVTGSCGTSGPGAQAQIVQLLGVGTHLIEIDGNSGSAAGTVHVVVQHVPMITAGVVTSGSQLPATFSVSGTTASSSNTTASCGLGPDIGYWWASCPSGPPGTLSATTCGGAAYDTVLQLLNGSTAGGGCNNDSCGQQSNLSAAVPGGAGIHVMYVDGATSSSSGTFTVTGTHP